MPGRRLLHGLLLASVAACADLTAPPPRAPDPYVVSARGVRVFGETRIPLLLARFFNGPASPFTPAQVRERMFAGSNGGPVNAPFRVASDGRFLLRVDASPWIASSWVSTAANADFVRDLIAAADATMDFGEYDNDGPDLVPNSGDDDGLVDGGVIILHSSLDLACSVGGANANSGPHPHARTNWRMGDPPDAYRTADAAAVGGTIGIQGYTIMSATDCSGVTMNSPVLAHELGHLLFGLPDLYHQVPGVPVPSTELWRGRRWVVGCWDLMAAGSWGCGGGPPSRPPGVMAGLAAWSRMSVGWASPIVASASPDTTYELSAAGRGGTVLRIEIAAGEYLLVEYREPIAGDMMLPGAGVLIHHITESLPIRPALGTDPRLYRVALVEADDDSALVRIEAEGGNRGVLSDAFGRTVTTFSTATHSAARATSGAPLPFRLEEISFNEATHKARVRVVRDP